MWETRASLVCCFASVLLLSWLVVSEVRAPGSAEPRTDGDGSEILHLRRELQEVRSALERLEAAVARTTAERAPAVAGPRSAETQPHDDLQEQLRSIELAIQTIASSLHEEDHGGQSHALEDIRRSHPSTNWAACEAIIARAVAEPGADGRGHFDSDDSRTLADLLMLRPGHVLEKVGAPSRTKAVWAGAHVQFVWEYHSPTVGADGRPEIVFSVTYLSGHVWDVAFSLP